MTNLNTEAAVEIAFTGAGEYWLNETNGEGAIPLGECASAEEVRAAISEVLAAGTGDETWFGWVADRG
jgi:hypothetical protein